MNTNALRLMGVLIAGLGASSGALAVPTYCSAGSPHPDGISTSNVTFRGTAADDCFGVQLGNDSGAHGAYIGWDGFSQLLSDDAADAVGATNFWGGVNWSLSGATRAKSGTYTLSWSDPLPINLPLTLDLIVVLKSSDRFASWLFNDELFQADPSTGTGTWEIKFRNNGGRIPNLSHLNLWVRGDTTTKPPEPPTNVPEPGTLGLVAIGLTALCLAGRRRRHG